MTAMSLTAGFEVVLAGVIVACIVYYCWIVRLTRPGGELSRSASAYSDYGKPPNTVRSDDSTCADGPERDSLAIRLTVDMDDYEYRDSSDSFSGTLVATTRPRNPSL